MNQHPTVPDGGNRKVEEAGEEPADIPGLRQEQEIWLQGVGKNLRRHGFIVSLQTVYNVICVFVYTAVPAVH